MKNTTIAMVAVLAAVVMLSAGLAVAPMQQASATTVMNGGGDSEVKTGDNKVIIKQSNECEEVIIACGNFLRGEITQNTGEDDFPPGPP
jgi:hypothetical protein